MVAHIVPRVRALTNYFEPESQIGLPMPANLGSDFKGRGVPDISGDNSVDGVTGYVSAVGWDAVTEFGSPSGANLFEVLSQGNADPSGKPIA
jgi:hypothetical protein